MDASKLQNRDYTLVIDRSGSMDTKDCPNNQSRWKNAEETTTQIAGKLQEFDPDGITVMTFAGDFDLHENTRDDGVAAIFKSKSPGGGTSLAPVLQNIFDRYTAEKKAGNTKPNGAIVMIITDGAPQDGEAVARAITNFTKTLADGREEFGIEIVQVGQDADARNYLKKLDSGLTNAKYDIVGVTTMDELNAGKKSIQDALIDALTA